MLRDGKVQCGDGKWRHKLTKDIGEVCKFVYAYYRLGFANESLDSVLKKHANAGRVQERKKAKTNHVTKMSAKVVKQMMESG